jgi:acyl dehydratase
MEQAIYYEDYQLGHVRTTTGRTITETDFVVHAGHTGDFFPHHMDAEFAKTTPFGQRIAHGTMVFAIGVGLTATLINPVAFSYGYDRLRFIKPVFIGDTIYAIRTNLDKRPRYKDMGLIRASYEIFKGEGELVLYCEHLQTVKYKNPADFVGKTEK